MRDVVALSRVATSNYFRWKICVVFLLPKWFHSNRTTSESEIKVLYWLSYNLKHAPAIQNYPVAIFILRVPDESFLCLICRRPLNKGEQLAPKNQRVNRLSTRFGSQVINRISVRVFVKLEALGDAERCQCCFTINAVDVRPQSMASADNQVSTVFYEERLSEVQKFWQSNHLALSVGWFGLSERLFSVVYLHGFGLSSEMKQRYLVNSLLRWKLFVTM